MSPDDPELESTTSADGPGESATKKRGITRHDVTTASAWAVPVVALAIASN